MDKFDPKTYCDKKLAGNFLLGYHLQVKNSFQHEKTKNAINVEEMEGEINGEF